MKHHLHLILAIITLCTTALFAKSVIKVSYEEAVDDYMRSYYKTKDIKSAATMLSAAFNSDIAKSSKMTRVLAFYKTIMANNEDIAQSILAEQKGLFRKQKAYITFLANEANVKPSKRIRLNRKEKSMLKHLENTISLDSTRPIYHPIQIETVWGVFYAAPTKENAMRIVNAVAELAPYEGKHNSDMNLAYAYDFHNRLFIENLESHETLRSLCVEILKSEQIHAASKAFIKTKLDK